MKELFYFSNSELMIQVQTASEDNSLRYTSHRELTSEERELVERYLRNNFANSVYNLANLDYAGINKQLEQNLSQLQVTQKTKRGPTPTAPLTKHKKAEKAVAALISTSLSEYYFDKIGDLLVTMKNDPKVRENLLHYKSSLLDLISAYNVHSKKNISLASVLPKEFI